MQKPALPKAAEDSRKRALGSLGDNGIAQSLNGGRTADHSEKLCRVLVDCSGLLVLSQGYFLVTICKATLCHAASTLSGS